MLMPLIYMKTVFEANYSRKLSSLKHRFVAIPADAQLPDARVNAYLYWRWAFEAPPNVKLLVRQELGEDNTPQVGHLYPGWMVNGCQDARVPRKGPDCKAAAGSVAFNEAQDGQRKPRAPACSGGDSAGAQGHLRLVLLPIVYNAMALKEQLRQLPLFRALRTALRSSTYDRLLRHPPSDPTTPEKQAR